MLMKMHIKNQIVAVRFSGKEQECTERETGKRKQVARRYREKEKNENGRKLRKSRRAFSKEKIVIDYYKSLPLDVCQA